MAEEQTGPGGPDQEEIHRGSGLGEHHAEQGPSQVDAMGENKRREVVGHSYGPSRKSQVMFFVAVGLILVVVVGGWSLAVAAFDQPPDSNPDKAPWSTADAPQVPTHDPSGPCGEPGSVYPPPADSPCATGVNSSGEAAEAGGDTKSKPSS